MGVAVRSMVMALVMGLFSIITMFAVKEFQGKKFHLYRHFTIRANHEDSLLLFLALVFAFRKLQWPFCLAF